MIHNFLASMSPSLGCRGITKLAAWSFGWLIFWIMILPELPNLGPRANAFMMMGWFCLFMLPLVYNAFYEDCKKEKEE